MKARVNIETARKSYKPGDEISEKLSAADLEFLRKHNFVTDDSGEGLSADESALPVGSYDDSGIPGMEDMLSDAGDGYKDEAALKKLNKDEIVEYAASIGLELASDALKSDLINSVLNYIEEKTAEQE